MEQIIRSKTAIVSSPLIFGEVLFDHFPDKQVLGGAPFNVAWNLHMLGHVPRFISAVGFDEQADKILCRMSQCQLPTDSVQRNQFPTGAVNVSFVDGEPEYEIPLGQAFDHIEYDPVTIASVTPSLLYHGSLIWRNPTSRETLTRLRSNMQTPVFVDLNLREPWFDQHGLAEILGGISILKLNKNELKVVTGIPVAADDNAVEVAAVAFKRQHRLDQLWVTAGSEGAWLFDQDDNVSWEAVPPVGEFVDSVGAGDAFAAYVIYGFLNELPAQTTLRQAVRFATRICQIRGATSQDSSVYIPVVD